MRPRARSDARQMSLDHRVGKMWHDLIEMQVLQQLKTRGPEDVRVLQNLEGIPPAILSQHR